MSRLWLPITLLALVCSGCRAKPEACEGLARHVDELAEAEGKGSPGARLAIESDCLETPPTRKLMSCMMAAEDLAQLEAC